MRVRESESEENVRTGVGEDEACDPAEKSEDHALG